MACGNKSRRYCTRACYVHARFGTRGVAAMTLELLEAEATVLPHSAKSAQTLRARTDRA